MTKAEQREKAIRCGKIIADIFPDSEYTLIIHEPSTREEPYTIVGNINPIFFPTMFFTILTDPSEDIAKIVIER